MDCHAPQHCREKDFWFLRNAMDHQRPQHCAENRGLDRRPGLRVEEVEALDVDRQFG